jgi:hypothetical protein
MLSKVSPLPFQLLCLKSWSVFPFGIGFEKPGQPVMLADLNLGGIRGAYVL